MAELRMPKMGDGMTEGTITSWLKKEGDQINEGEDIAEVETDKANVAIPAEDSGILARILVQAGQTVPVGEVIAQIGEPASAGTQAPQGNGAHAPRAGDARPPEPLRPQAPVPSAEGGTVAREDSTLAPQTTPQPPIAAELRSMPPPPAGPDVERIKASPLARRMADEMGIDLAFVRGSGPGGRIVERDILSYHAGAQQRPSLPATRPTLPPAVSAPAAPPAAAAGTGYTETPVSRMRDAIGRRTVLSKTTIPHFYVTMVVEMDRALALLKEMNADAPDSKVTVSEIIIKACAVALQRVPQVNAALTQEGKIRTYDALHIGFAVGIDEGLVVPVIRDCQGKSLRQLSAEAKALIGKARSGQLRPEEYSGGTFSISNLGMMGVDEFIAVINPPEAAILAIGGVVREPVIVGDTDEIAIRSRMKITLSSDHRLLDGVVAARFLQEVKKALEAPFGLVG